MFRSATGGSREVIPFLFSGAVGRLLVLILCAAVNAVRDRVYIDGGELTWEQRNEDGSVEVDSDEEDASFVYYMNLSSSFNAPTMNFTAIFGSVPKPGAGSESALAALDGYMFANDATFWLYGGIEDPFGAASQTSADAVLAYEPSKDGDATSEDQFTTANMGTVTRYITHGAGVSIPSENLGFYVSGARAPDWGPIWDNTTAFNLSRQMVKVNMSERPADAIWSNVSLPEHIPPRVQAEAVWVPVSEAGAVVLIGGVTMVESLIDEDSLSEAQQAESERISPSFMTTVSIYDIARDTWYNQNTTGDAPPMLAGFCAVYASAPDNSSHNIYVYGGYDGINYLNPPVDTAYVLSLPSFEWIRLYTGDSRRLEGRRYHNCVKPYPDRMLVIGGTILGGERSCIDGAIRVFNLNSGEFQNTYDPAIWSEYEVPSLVSEQIGGNSSGFATRTSPATWTNESLSQLFATPYTKPIATWYPYASDSSTATQDSDGSSGFPAWAGGLIGGLLGLLALCGIAGAAWWLRRRRRRRRPGHQGTPKEKKASDLAGLPEGGGWQQPAHEAGSGIVHEIQGTETNPGLNHAAVELPASRTASPLARPLPIPKASP
ncbi:uncharacterized protein DSM5745_06590 [Aspergillus mulundensis]|uniref:Kelch repeat protein n=1 Tax=Aspergillus mulundensis TaxID=1810919 RepID=A0A3D8RRM1_9EURO|nr:hypothetical protein DSM5745_06590 [Aspergillus mulundensis]RDW76598.1 hypothetical protein DSM5745_06590 [Aspergillus mulundensis]